MKYRYVWRLERNGKGAFASGLMYDSQFHGDHCGHHNCNLSSPPGPFNVEEHGTEVYDLFANGTSKELEGYYFGFLTLKQYLRWCNSKYVRQDLEQHGGELKRYKVPANKVAKGNWQCVFMKSKAECVETRSPAYC